MKREVKRVKRAGGRELGAGSGESEILNLRFEREDGERSEDEKEQ